MLCVPTWSHGPPPPIPYILTCAVLSHSVMSNSLWSHGLQSMEFYRSRIPDWAAYPFSRGSSQSRDQTQVSRIAGRFFTSWATRKAQEYWSGLPCPPPGDLPNPGIKPRSPALQENSLPFEPRGKPYPDLCVYYCPRNIFTLYIVSKIDSKNSITVHIRLILTIKLKDACYVKEKLWQT